MIMKLRMIKQRIQYFSAIASILAFRLWTFHSPSLRTQALEKIKRYFEDYKSQIKKKLERIGQPKNRKNEIRCEVLR